MMFSVAAIVFSLVLSPSPGHPSPQELPAGHQHPGDHAVAQSAYAGSQASEIKVLSGEEIQALRQGMGHGMATPAELNHYPGPRHVLDLAADLDLTDSQISQVRAIFERMHVRAVSLGEKIIDRERALDRAFAAGALDDARLQDMVGEIGRLRSALRATHLKAHLETRAVLRPEQVSRYDVLRGYAAR